MQTKKCSKCGEVKALDEFHKNADGGHGRTSRCKVCRNAEKRRWKKATSEKVKASSAAWRAANREKIKAYSAAWRAANPAKVKAYSAAHGPAWVAANPEKRKQTNRRTVEAATDAYIATIVGVPVALLPQDFIEAKRAHLKLVRKLKELK